MNTSDENKPLVDLTQYNAQKSLELKTKELQLRQHIHQNEMQMNESIMQMNFHIESSKILLKNAQLFTSLMNSG